MNKISCYDDTNNVIEYLCDKLDITEPEVIDWLLDIATTVDNDELADALRDLKEDK